MKITTLGLLALTTASPALAQDAPSVGMSVGSLGHPFFAATIKGAEDALHEIDPAAQLTTVSSEWDLGKQDGQVDTFLSAGNNLILINAADPQAIGAAVERARAAGVTVAAFDVAAAGADVTIMTDNVKAGNIACTELANQLGGEGRVVIIGGPSVSSVIDRVQGCTDALATFPGLEVVNESQNPGAGRDGGFAAMQAYLTRFPEIDGVFTINDEQAIGANLAAEQGGRSEMKIAAVDGSPEVVQMLRDGGSRIVATAAQNPYMMGYEAVRLGWGIHNGQPSEHAVTLLEPSLVTSANAGAVEGWPQSK